MVNLIEFIKEKIYYIIAATILLFVILLIINACSGTFNNSYEEIESNMVKSAKAYFSSRKEKLPKQDGEISNVTIATLVEAELLDEVTDPKTKKTCQGYVQVKKIDEDYVFTPILSCKGSYELKYLSDVVKDSELDEYGNGVYLIGNEYVYRGDSVNNYVSFNDQTWRILRVNSNNEIKIILVDTIDEEYQWDTSFNVTEDQYVGVTSDYLNTNMRKLLLNYYQTNFSEDSKAKIVKKNWCIGGLLDSDNFNNDKECLKIKENENIGLINVSDYGAATLDINCSNPQQEQCTNRNYLASSGINSWTMNIAEENNYQVYIFINGNVFRSYASDSYSINPVIYLSSDTVITGKGTIEEPYIVK